MRGSETLVDCAGQEVAKRMKEPAGWFPAMSRLVWEGCLGGAWGLGLGCLLWEGI